MASASASGTGAALMPLREAAASRAINCRRKSMVKNLIVFMTGGRMQKGCPQGLGN